MDRITLGKLFELYFNTFEKFGLHLLEETDEMLGYYVFEATDISIGYCSKRILTKFLDEGIIDEIIFERSSSLLEDFRRIASTTSLRNVESIRISTEWRELMELSDGIKKLIKTRWTDKELRTVFELDQPTGLII